MHPQTKELDKWIQEDYAAHMERLTFWKNAAEKMIEEHDDSIVEDPLIHDFLVWSKMEFARRRKYLDMEESELEKRAGELVRQIVKMRMQEP